MHATQNTPPEMTRWKPNGYVGNVIMFDISQHSSVTTQHMQRNQFFNDRYT